MGLKKTHSKLDEVFSAHNVDSWVLANSLVGGHIKPDNESILRMVPLQFSRRQLNRLKFSSGGIRNRYGGTKSGEYTRGMLIRHRKYGLCYVGGYIEKNKNISLHNFFDGKRLHRNGKKRDMQIMCYDKERRESPVALA